MNMSEQIRAEILYIGKVERAPEGLQLRIFEPYRRALNGLELFSHAIVVWWCHNFNIEECRQTVECDKPYKNGPKKIGIFATRAPIRPNPIAISAVAILRIDHKKGIIQIPWIDAMPDTPIIDLKPYHPSMDRIRDASVPTWCSHWPKWSEDSASFDWEAEGI